MWKQTNQEVFFAYNEPVFRQRETEFIPMIFFATHNISDPKTVDFYTFIENDKPCAQAIRSGNRLEVGILPQHSVSSLVGHLSTPKPQISEIRGFAESVDLFVPKWTQKHSSTAELFLHAGLYTLDTLTLPPLRGGNLICAGEEHKPISARFIRGFLDDCFPELTNPERHVAKDMEKLIDKKNLFLWQNNKAEFVSIAAQVRTSWNTASISRVYTPPQYRGKGYARCVTGMLSDKIMREQNRTCNLFADVNNPSSNYVYRSLGYYKINEEKSVFLPLA